MLKSYFVVGLRSLLRRGLTTAINIAGLALGFAAALVIGLYAMHELTYDQYHAQSENIYLVYKERVTPAGTQATYDTWVPLVDRLKDELPDVEHGTRIYFNNIVVEVGNRRFEEGCYYVDPAYFEIFDFPLVAGNSQAPFEHLNSVIISQEVAQRLFGEQNAIGQEIRVDFEMTYTVAGILEEYPANSFVGAEILMPIQSTPDYADFENEWGSSFLFSFITIPQESGVTEVEAQFPGLVERIWDAEVASRTNFRLLPLHECYDTFVGDTGDSYILLYVALGILVIAIVNFMNLASARSSERSREIGMRKVLGASQGQVAYQFLAEAALVSLGALALGTLIAALSLPYLNRVFEMSLQLPWAEWPLLFAGLLTFALVVGLLSGSYPAFLLSRLRILASLRTSDRMAGSAVRNGLVVFQFVISAVLIVGALTIYQQVRYMKNAEMTFNKENLLVIPVSERDFEERDEARLRLSTFRSELENHSSVSALTTSRHVPGRWSGSNTFVRPEGWEGDPLRMRYTFMDAEFFESYGIQLLEGPGFLPDEQGDQRSSVVLNEAAMRAFGWENIDEKAIMIGSNRLNVVGLVKDFNYETLRSEVAPTLHFHRVPSNAAHRYVTVRIAAGQLESSVAYFEEKWSILDQSRPLEYFLVEDDMAEMYANEDRLLALINVFSVLSIVIACLGLYGLVSFLVDKRKKEIGIRKVLGASVAHISLLMSRKFMMLVIISFLIGAPIAYYTMQGWLNDFAYRIQLSGGIFIVTLVLSLGIAWLTVSLKSASVALINPVDAIRDE